MKLKKSQIKEFIRQTIGEFISEKSDIMAKIIKFKTDDGEEKESTVGGILKKGKDHPAHKQAIAMVDKGEKTKKSRKISIKY